MKARILSGPFDGFGQAAKRLNATSASSRAARIRSSGGRASRYFRDAAVKKISPAMNDSLSLCPRTLLQPSCTQANPCQAFSKSATIAVLRISSKIDKNRPIQTL